MYILDMFSWSYQTIVVVESHLQGYILLKDKGVQGLSR